MTTPKQAWDAGVMLGQVPRTRHAVVMRQTGPNVSLCTGQPVTVVSAKFDPTAAASCSQCAAMVTARWS